MRRGIALLAVLAGTGCATNLSNLKTAETLEQGQFRPSVGMGVFVPAGQIGRAVKLAVDQAAELDEVVAGTAEPPDEAEQRAIYETALALGMFPVGTNFEFGLRYGIVENFDAGLRWSTASWRLDGRYRFFKGERMHLAGVLGLERQSFGGVLYDAYERLQSLFGLFDRFVQLDDPWRYDVDAMFIASWNLQDILLPYVTAAYRAGFYGLHLGLDIPLPNSSSFSADVNVRGVTHMVNVGGGVGVGYKYVHLFLELDIGWLFSKPKILGEKANLGGLTVYPAFGLAVKFP